VAFAFIASPVNSSLFEEVFMNDIRRTFLWVIFGFSMVLLWDQWQIYNGHKATFFPKPVAATAEQYGRQQHACCCRLSAHSQQHCNVLRQVLHKFPAAAAASNARQAANALMSAPMS
jgi:hypothetical protein